MEEHNIVFKSARWNSTSSTLGYSRNLRILRFLDTEYLPLAFVTIFRADLSCFRPGRTRQGLALLTSSFFLRTFIYFSISPHFQLPQHVLTPKVTWFYLIPMFADVIERAEALSNHFCADNLCTVRFNGSMDIDRITISWFWYTLSRWNWTQLATVQFFACKMLGIHP